MMTDLYASMLLYIASVGKWNRLKFWRYFPINSYTVVLFTPYHMAKLFEFQEGYVTSTVVSMDMSEILRVLCEKDNKV